MKNFVIACLMTAMIAGCASAPPPRSPDDTILAVVGLLDCGNMKGILVVTKSGKIVALDDTEPRDLTAAAKGLPPGSAVTLNMAAFCPPTETTGFHPPR